MKTYEVKIELLSPLHLGSGHADVIRDAEAVKDKYGMPFFPGKRLKGLLYESALEMAEIGKWFTVADVSRLFAREVKDDNALLYIDEGGLCVENFLLPQYMELCNGWEYLQKQYEKLFTNRDVWETYTEYRYQTAIDKNTKTAKDTSLRNLIVVDAGMHFEGKIILRNDTAINADILEKALVNLRYAGAKRNRGFGHIKCTFRVKKG